MCPADGGRLTRNCERDRGRARCPSIPDRSAFRRSAPLMVDVRQPGEAQVADRSWTGDTRLFFPSCQRDATNPCTGSRDLAETAAEA